MAIETTAQALHVLNTVGHRGCKAWAVYAGKVAGLDLDGRPVRFTFFEAIAIAQRIADVGAYRPEPTGAGGRP